MSQFRRYFRICTFHGLVAAGAVLSIISIVVVLEFRAPGIPAEISPDQLRATLKSARQLSEARHAAPIPLQFDSADVASALAENSRRGRALTTFYDAQQDLVSLWKGRRETLLAENVEAAEAAVLTYAAESRRPGERDRLERFMAIRMWHHKQTRGADKYLDTTRAMLGDVNEALLALRDARDTAAVSTAVADVSRRMRAARLALSRSHAYQPIDARAERPLVVIREGRIQSVHPFSGLTGWMRGQQSPELASIFGMLGFGLLGAAASTFVRRRKGRDRAQIGDNLTALVVSGTTAAFATYLAMKGSLAIVSTDGAEPNPYVLLLTCFVAAVYWEEAWERVRNAVRRDQRDEDDDAEADDPSSDRQSGDQAGARKKVQAPPMASVTPDEATPDPKGEPAPAPQPA